MTLTEYFIHNVQLQREWAFDKNAVSADELTPSADRQVWWRCEKGHEWQAAPSSRVNQGESCPDCASHGIVTDKAGMASAVPRMAKLWHPTRNGSLQPTAVPSGSDKRYWWQCEKGHEWQARADAIKAGGGCPYCFGRYAIPGETDLATTHPQVLTAWSDRNTLTPAKLTAGSHKKVWWRCGKGHEWEASVVSYVLDQCGCPYCAGRRAIPGETDLATLRPDLTEQWDWERNTIDPRETTVAAHDKVWWRCELGHSWEAAVFSRAKDNGSGCPYCTGKKVLAGFNDLATLKPALADEWYQPLNDDLTPEQVSLGSNKKVWWRCGEHHVWQAAIYSRTRKKGAGCPVCAGIVKQKPERPSKKLRSTRRVERSVPLQNKRWSANAPTV